jgi:oxygen-independent coproporphyrinogen-3 oxidase
MTQDIQHLMRPGTLSLSSLPPLSLYVHLPWCLKKCPYCDFNSHELPGNAAGELPEQRYLDALCADLAQPAPHLGPRRAQHLHWRGHAQLVFACRH